MKNEDMQALTSRIQEKLGDETSALISDDLGLLLSDTQAVNQEKEKLNKTITKLNQDKENLINTNGKLLQQVSMSLETPEPNKYENIEPKKITFKDCFDEKRKFYIKRRAYYAKYKRRISYFIK